MASDGLWHPLLDLAVGFASPAGEIWGIPGLAAIAKSERGWVGGGAFAAKIAPARRSATAVPWGGGGFGHSVGTGVQGGGFACPACGIHTAAVNARPSSCCSCTFAVLLEEPLEVHLVFADFFWGGSALFCPPALVRCWGQVGLEERFAAKYPILLGFSQLEDEGRNNEAKEINAFSAIIPVHTQTK